MVAAFRVTSRVCRNHRGVAPAGSCAAGRAFARAAIQVIATASTLLANLPRPEPDSVLVRVLRPVAPEVPQRADSGPAYGEPPSPAVELRWRPYAFTAEPLLELPGVRDLASERPCGDEARETDNLVCRGNVNYLQGLPSRDSPDGAGRLQANLRASTAGASPFSVDFSGQVPWDTLESPSTSGEVGAPNSGLSRFTVSRDFNGLASLRAGRYTPPELPAVGKLDGLQAEIRPAGALKAGAIFGLKPARSDLDASSERPVAAGYLCTRLEAGSILGYSGTLGMLSTVYEGEVDRLACLVSQRADIGSRLSIQSGLEFDLHSAAASESAAPVQLTTLSLQASTPVTSFLTLRAGFRHDKRPDTREERALAAGTSAASFEQGDFRRWIGGSQTLPWNLSMEEEFSLTDPAASEETSDGWRVRLRRSGLPGLPAAGVSVTCHDIEDPEVISVGSRIAGSVSFLRGKLSLSPSVGLVIRNPGESPDPVRVTDVSLQARWRVNDDLNVVASTAYAFAKTSNPSLLRVGVQWWF